MRLDGGRLGVCGRILACGPRGKCDLRHRDLGLEPDGKLGTTMKAQARRALVIIIAAIEALGGKASDVVRTRIYVTDIDLWRDVADAHHEFFESIRPATTMVQVARLIDPEALVEIEANAVVRQERTNA